MRKVILDRPHSGKQVAKSVPGPALRPKDSATLIMVRQDGPKPRVLMGKRHESSTFMPNIYVFPGGRVDKADSRVTPASQLDSAVEEKLQVKMRGRPSSGRARALAMAAIRETFEETGLLIGTEAGGKRTSAHKDWAEFLSTGLKPQLSPMRYIARAITPPGRVRRFDSRFFVVGTEHVANLDAPRASTDELIETHWLTFAETRDLDLPWITGQVLKLLEAGLASGEALAPGGPVMFQYMEGKKWYEETL
ncbi:MAG: NUDIX hydrolase [Pseudomonadota bacterium]